MSGETEAGSAEEQSARDSLMNDGNVNYFKVNGQFFYGLPIDIFRVPYALRKPFGSETLCFTQQNELARVFVILRPNEDDGYYKFLWLVLPLSVPSVYQ